MLKFHCPHCDQKIGLPQQYAGKQVRCAKCKQIIVVPTASEQNDVTDKGVIRFECSGCKRKLKVSQKHAGRQVKCPKCGVPIAVPRLTDEKILRASSTGSTISDELLESYAGTGDFPEQAEKTPPPVQQEGSLKFQPTVENTSGSVRCSSCGAVHSAGRKFCTLCGQSLTAGASDSSKQAPCEAQSDDTTGKSNIVLAILVSIVFAAVGGIVWCVAARFIGIGWMSFMAVVVCCLAGAGFYLCTQNRSVGVGILAGVIGFMGILNGKTLIARYVAMPQMKEFFSEGADQLGKAFENSPMQEEFYEDMIKNDDLMFVIAAMQLAEEGQIEEELVDDIMAERTTGRKDPEKAEQIEQAKTKIRDALDNWDNQKKKEVAKAQYGKVSRKYVHAFMESEAGKTMGFIWAWFWSLSCQDIVWFPLGVFCAYKVARGEDY